MKILSLQSRVASGHVGNSAAVFALQRLGFEVVAVDTVLFSNHPGHPGWKGRVHDPQLIADLVDGLDRTGVLSSCDAVLTGYLGDAETGETVLRAVEAVKRARPDAIWLCDPVIGDGGRVYVRSGLEEFFAGPALEAADVMTPNRFELERLIGGAVAPGDERAAAGQLLGAGPKLVVVTGIERGGDIATLGVTADGAWAVTTPKLVFDPPVNGAGDLFSALLLARLLKGDGTADALSFAVSALFAVLERSKAQGGRDLALVGAQEALIHPGRLFPAEALE